MLNKKRLGDLLLSLRLVTPEQVEKALQIQQLDKRPLGSIFVTMGAITEDLLLNALASQIGVWPWRLDQNPPEPKAVEKVPGNLCQLHQMLPVSIRGDLLLLAMVNPHNIEALDLVRVTTGMRIEPVLADAARLTRCIEEIHGDQPARVASDLDELVDAALRDFKIDRKSRENDKEITEVDTRPVVELVNQILTDAIRSDASDIHVEPRHDRIEVRYRIDGQLRLSRTLPESLLPMLVTRLKIMSELDIVEFRIPQDGRVGVTIDGRQVDLRVSVLPNHHGQRIVMRILDKSKSLKKLDELGFTGTNLELFRSLVSKPYGMFLVTGPTGSGKTTTLYAALQELRNGANNVMTCEDPVEYDIDGVNQSQVHDKVGLTFARQLRAILRQDPDVILVGEIRDGETAETAIRAALTGHMVLSTLHCNDAPSAIPRLADMGIDPFLLSTSLIGAMSQRLIRKLCTSCCVADRPSAHEVELFEAYGMTAPDSIQRPLGCVSCGHTGYRGRRAIHEIMPITPVVSKLIGAREPVETVREAAMAHGFEPMQVRALQLVREGSTSMEEAERVVFLDVAHAQPSQGGKTIKLRAA